MIWIIILFLIVFSVIFMGVYLLMVKAFYWGGDNAPGKGERAPNHNIEGKRQG